MGNSDSGICFVLMLSTRPARREGVDAKIFPGVPSQSRSIVFHDVVLYTGWFILPRSGLINEARNIEHRLKKVNSQLNTWFSECFRESFDDVAHLAFGQRIDQT
jgi:hypothetical protein